MGKTLLVRAAGVWLLLAAGLKVVQPEPLARFGRETLALDTSSASVFVWAFIVVEAAVGVMALVRPLKAALFVGIMFAGFSLFHASRFAQRVPGGCPCFGEVLSGFGVALPSWLMAIVCACVALGAAGMQAHPLSKQQRKQLKQEVSGEV